MTNKASYYIAIIAAALLAGCTLNDPDEWEQDVLLTFDPVLLVASKADAPTGEYPTDQPFGVDAWDYPVKGSGSSHLFLSAAKVSFDGSVWAPAGGVLWPSKKRQVSFLAHSPFGKAASVSLDGGGVVFSGVDVLADQTDLLYSDLLEGLSKTGGGVVNVPFRHALCYVDFAMRTNALAGDKVEVKSVSLMELSTTGSFNSLPQPIWKDLGTAHEVQYFAGSKEIGGSAQVLGPGMWTIPQAVETYVHVTLVHTLGNGIVQAYTMDSEKLSKHMEPGRHYTITVTYLPEEGKVRLDETLYQGL